MAYRFPGQGQQVGLNYLAGQPPPVVPGYPMAHDWGRGMRLGNGLPVPPGNMGQFLYAPVGAEEYEELERLGAPPPGYLGPLQNAGIVRRAGEQLPLRNMARRAAGVGLLAGQPIAAAALVADHAWGNDHQGPMGPSQLRVGKQKKQVKIKNKANVRPFAYNEEAEKAGNANHNYEENVHGNRPNRYPARMGIKGPKATLGYPPDLDPNDPRREGPSGAQRYYGPNGTPSNQNVTNQQNRLLSPTEGNERRVAVNLHEELKGPIAAPSPSPAPPRGPGLLGRLFGAVGAIAGSSGSGHLTRQSQLPAPSSSSSSSSSSFANMVLEGGRSRRQKKKKSTSKSRKHRTRRLR